MSIGPRPAPASPLQAWMLIWCALAVGATCALYWTLGGPAFADFAVYTAIAEELGGRNVELRILGPEGFSRGLLRLFQLLFGEGDYAVGAMALVCQTLVALAVAAAARWRTTAPANLLLAVALFAPLLSLITVRATPAYLLCTAAVAGVRLAERPRMWWVVAAGAGALLFHLSAAFVILGGVVAGAIPARVSRVALLVLATGAGAGALVVRESLNVDTVLALAGGATVLANPLFSERLAYFAEAATPVSAPHLVYFALVSLLVARVVLMAPPHPSDRLVLTLYALYAACLVSPVIAYRNSYYVLLPLVATAPRPILPFGNGLLGQALHAVTCVGLLVLTIAGVLQPG